MDEDSIMHYSGGMSQLYIQCAFEDYYLPISSSGFYVLGIE